MRREAGAGRVREWDEAGLSANGRKVAAAVESAARWAAGGRRGKAESGPRFGDYISLVSRVLFDEVPLG